MSNLEAVDANADYLFERTKQTVKIVRGEKVNRKLKQRRQAKEKKNRL